ncbi:DAN4-like protein [Fusarium heterosporum]|uniref:DAN4-like protein n=1 Tax=Fusarium heterosporum TaxID=42747 RepID=A0A8H5TFS5_FUSHE|nr:DAN4-like protein [Fusarium heterosporum]
MVSLKVIAVVYAAANLLGVDAGLCRPSSRTSSISTSTSANSAIPSGTTTSKDLTLSTDGTTSTNPTTSGNPSLSTSETLSQATSSSNPTTFEVSIVSSATSSNPTVSVDSATSGSLAASSDATTSADTTATTDTTTAAESTTVDNNTSGTTTAEDTNAADTTTAVGTTTGADTTTSAESTIVDTTTADTTTAESTTAADTTTADTTTAADTTTTADLTTTSAEPTTTTSACVEPTNLLRQPGFEPSDNDGAWGFYWGGGSVQVDSQHARTGDGLAVLPVPDGQERRMEQRIHIVAETEYSVKFYYAVDNPPSVNTQCFLFATFDYYTTLTQVPLPSDTAYHMYSASFISADNLDPVIEIGISCPTANNGYTATIYIDDASVLDTTNACDATPVDPDAPLKSTLLIPAEPEAPQCPVNVVRVPGFEPVNGNQGWAFYNRGEFVQDQSNARTGEWEALLPSGTRNDPIYLEQQFSAQDLSAGETYDYHFFWKPNTLPDNGQCYITGGYNDAVQYTAAEVNSGATSSTGYTIFSVRFTMPSGNLLLQIVFYCDYYNGNSQLGSVFVDDTALIKVGGCDAYPATGALIENPSFEIRATEDSTYAWFGTNGMSIKAGSTPNGPSPRSDNNYLYVQLESKKRSATLTKPLASALSAGQSYDLSFYWAAGPDFTPGDCSFTIAFGSTTQTFVLATSATLYDYKLFQSSFTPDEAVKSMTMTVSCGNTEPDFAFDDFALQ